MCLRSTIPSQKCSVISIKSNCASNLASDSLTYFMSLILSKSIPSSNDCALLLKDFEIMTSLLLRQLKLPYTSSVRTPLEKLTPELWGRPYLSFSISRPGTERIRCWRVEHCRKDVEKFFDSWITRFFLIWWIGEELFERIAPAGKWAFFCLAAEEIVVSRPKSRKRIANCCKCLNFYVGWNLWINSSYLDFRSVWVKNWGQVVHVPSIMIDHSLSGL